jgi:hypothetical protein
MAERPRPQEIYRHFKGNLYQVLTIATHSETREEMVVYQALYGDYKVYVRPLDMFLSEVDRNKYPEVRQKMRFEKVSPTQAPKESKALKEVEVSKAAETPEKVEVSKASSVPQRTATLKETVTPQHKPLPDFDRDHPVRLQLDLKGSGKTGVMSKSIDEEASDLNLDPLVIKFMDADLASDKNDILSRLRPTITNDMIDIMAMSVGVVINEGDVYDRYEDLRNCLSTMEKFESTRLR